MKKLSWLQTILESLIMSHLQVEGLEIFWKKDRDLKSNMYLSTMYQSKNTFRITKII